MIDLFQTLSNYFNTAKEEPKKVEAIKEDVSAQNQKIYNHFLINKGFSYSSSDLLNEQVLGKDVPITSYRRAVNTLMNRNLILRDGFKNSIFNRKEFTYKYNEYTRES